MVGELVAVVHGTEIGRVRQDARGKLGFSYAPSWRRREDAFPLSLSMPLALTDHGDTVIRPFLEGLLPDNLDVLHEWGRRFHVSPNNPFMLLGRVGEDCPGAVQFAPPERVDALLRAAPGEVEWLAEADVARRLRALRGNQGAWREMGDVGYFSLAGAQPKTALLRDGDRWGVPSGRTPTTHILKPPVGHYAGFAENEHVCLRLARALGLAAARTEVCRFEDQVAIVVERYDRMAAGGAILRVHQEDCCQALGVSPRIKYEAEGGPGAVRVIQVLEQHGSHPDADVATFVDALALNWAIGGTDAHAKNYSLLIGGHGQTRLAPLYDIASALPYHYLQVRKLKLAMRVGGEYRLLSIERRHWERFAGAVGLDAGSLVQRVADVAAAVPDLLADACSQARAEGLDDPILDKLTDTVAENARRIISKIKRASPAMT
ncbi:type II toxin-antitoxin system HipA family toxin [Longimicrobium sp.]|uniref:type II toxin-antitoxin system HipA family toxin n=1 Tax=Longimicrobium sp. TaxID=2029185 RepID=UPI002E3506DE|nr:type II toxin-antitoxin system HipA family toxin [Longimicrobium sp.]HEX6039334.1 type II toxin-antitoxin system HipA family toxin [Longimicrobium sp.]